MILIEIVFIVIYFIPTIIVANRVNPSPIIALNILTGWTIIGWIISLVWALNRDYAKQEN